MSAPKVEAIICRRVVVELEGVPARRLAWSKIIAGHVVAAEGQVNADAVADWCARNGYVACGAVVGADEDWAVFWIDSPAHKDGARPEDYARILDEPVCGATVAFYRGEPGRNGRPAHLATSLRAGRIQSIRRRNATSQDDVAIVKFNRDLLEKHMLGESMIAYGSVRA